MCAISRTTPAASSPGRCSSACPARAPTGTTSRPRPWPTGPSRSSSSGRSICPCPQLVVADARAAMPRAAVVFFDDPTAELAVAGVTGTNGKTTTAFLLFAVLAAAGRRPGLLGTIECRVGGERRPAVRDDARGDRPAAHVPRDARRRRPELRDRGVVARLRARPPRRHPFLGSRVHQPEPGPPRLPRHDGASTTSRSVGCSSRPGRPRVNVGDPCGPAPRRRAARPGHAARDLRLRRRRRPAPRGARADSRGRAVPGRRNRCDDQPPWSLQRGERARGDRRCAPPRARRRCRHTRGRVAARRSRPVRSRRRGPALRRDRRLCPHPRGSRERSQERARPRRGTGGLRVRLRRRPRPWQAPVDGPRRQRARRPRRS